MDYCHVCRRHLNGALACPGCGTPVDELGADSEEADARPESGADADAYYGEDTDGRSSRAVRRRGGAGGPDGPPVRGAQTGTSRRDRKAAAHRRRRRRTLFVAVGFVLAAAGLSLAELGVDAPGLGPSPAAAGGESADGSASSAASARPKNSPSSSAAAATRKPGSSASPSGSASASPSASPTSTSGGTAGAGRPPGPVRSGPPRPRRPALRPRGPRHPPPRRPRPRPPRRTPRPRTRATASCGGARSACRRVTGPATTATRRSQHPPRSGPSVGHLGRFRPPGP